ncbi:MAG: hypothetical protein JW751_05675 [Polyangiaceae bacterium]|nr:hypothetical protein [Polyangiaceae bacterium]
MKPHPDSRSRLSVLAGFFGNGAIFATWVVRIPEFQTRHELGEGSLGLVLLCGDAGTMAALAATSGLIGRGIDRRHGNRRHGHGWRGRRRFRGDGW